MVYVRLEQEWTDGDGRTYSAGSMVDVDASTLATLQAEGVVQDGDDGAHGIMPASGGWSGPSGGDEPASGGWSGPSGSGGS